MSQVPATFTPDSEFADLETPRGPIGSCLSISALARFEFEAGRGNEGTKILMIEWEDDDLSRCAAEGSWHVSWTGKTTVLPADDRPTDSLRRFYFLLPPHVTIPPVVTLSYEPLPTVETDNTSTPSSQARDTLQLNPLPAIFPPELGATGRAAGKKGVLHTIWAKKRLRVLDNEIREECLNNAEGVAVQMAAQEKEWIEMNFGVTAHAADSSRESSAANSMYPTGPATPVSPISGRKLTDKLKGLKLQTSEKDLSANDSEFSAVANAPSGSLTNQDSGPNSAHLLSPQSPDVAVSSFSSFRNGANRSAGSLPTPVTNPIPTPSSSTKPTGLENLKPVALHPPESIQDLQQTSATSGFSAMNSMTSMSSLARTSSAESGEDLFAKALSPRSPDLPRSPFSFT
ncbi:hypothetical protein N7448_002674 [Penicillium atrosanguineum]|uniref:Uncharacterized protein n=1 Tax=Penicillium atrosanguineum TaxID=1132637 RepID=A0A9W9HE93_9EURO|nr:uncharacterized protein N7443_006079 [Penicillium atrosanguineum]KAJ5145282.1 hypothetical protein N7448_002674 [Penicillium atrosanguineum]KAJ5301077.1 hypothetical protein N7443_006079 [Penicillium atrosanguineum]KAJ5311721.1 hypothetical protein N7476_007581 [Penicillium atrosanguineum]